MNIINITEEQKNKLCVELARLVVEYKKDENVKCIYFAPYKGLGKIRGYVLELTLIKKDSIVDEKIKQYNESHQTEDYLREFGVKIDVEVEDEKKYTITDFNLSEIKKCNNLFNSTILFDRTGKYTKIKERLQQIGNNKAHGIFYYGNLAEINPPLPNELNNEEKIIQEEKDKEAAKKKIKSKRLRFFK